jgi:hypothetical protein
MLLAQSKLLKFDCYLLRFPTGAEVKPHTDPVDPAYKHYRLNIVVKRPDLGGRFVGKTLLTRVLAGKFQLFTCMLAMFVAGALLALAVDHMLYRVKERAAIAVVDSVTTSAKGLVSLVKRKCE